MLLTLLVFTCIHPTDKVHSCFPNHPFTDYYYIYVWHEVWDGADWKWTPADICPACYSHVIPKWVGYPLGGYCCPACHSRVKEDDWDAFNRERYYWVGWPDIYYHRNPSHY
jgi:hypothetical protein